MSSHHDANGVPTLLAVETNGATLVSVRGNPSTHALSTSDGMTGSDNGPTVSLRDNNHIPIFMATSNGDGKTPVAVYADSSGNLLVDSM